MEAHHSIRIHATDARQLQKHISGTYFGLRRGMALVGFGLPTTLVIGGLVATRNDDFQCVWICDSLSAYYGAGVPLLRDLFVGALLATAALLISYKGFSEAEDSLLNMAGFSAALLALIPTPHLTHRVAAITFFACMALICWFRASDTLPLVADEEVRRHFAARYKAQAIMMIGFPAAALGLSLTLDQSLPVIAVETAATLVFGWYWVTKSREMRRTHADLRAAARQLTLLRAEVGAREAGGSLGGRPQEAPGRRTLPGPLRRQAVVGSVVERPLHTRSRHAAGNGEQDRAEASRARGTSAGSSHRRGYVRIPNWVRFISPILGP